ncbi:MAG: hypothetical protein JW787_17570 [Sedimentisphaerales bacterium]|nr:hypothetical protein [Sedimentisphaerales bacterium]
MAMLACPTSKELAQLKSAVAIMTPSEKQNVSNLTDNQIHKIAKDAGVDTANFAIFINGYILHCKKT